MTRPTLPPDASATVRQTVEEGDLASRITASAHVTFPPVFATSRMIAWMEAACAEAMRPVVADGEQSVGVSVEVSHTAPTAPGATVRATGRFLGMRNKFYRFEVVAEDESGEVGRGLHERAIVTTERLLSGAERRRKSAE